MTTTLPMNGLNNDNNFDDILGPGLAFSSFSGSHHLGGQASSASWVPGILNINVVGDTYLGQVSHGYRDTWIWLVTSWAMWHLYILC